MESLTPQQIANLEINNYLNGKITMLKLQASLERKGIELYSLQRGKGRIKAHVKYDNLKSILNF